MARDGKTRDDTNMCFALLPRLIAAKSVSNEPGSMMETVGPSPRVGQHKTVWQPPRVGQVYHNVTVEVMVDSRYPQCRQVWSDKIRLLILRPRLSRGGVEH